MVRKVLRKDGVVLAIFEDGNIFVPAGSLYLDQTASPGTSVSGKGQLSVSDISELLFTDENGSVFNVSDAVVGAFSSMWYHGADDTTTIGNANEFTKIETFENVGPEDSMSHLVADATTGNDFTINLAGIYTISFQLSGKSAGGATREFHASPLILLNSPKTITDATNATPIVVTSAGHGLQKGDCVQQSGVGGNAAANGDFYTTYLTDDTYSLQTLNLVDVAGTGAYTSGGTVDTIAPGNIFMQMGLSNSTVDRGATSGEVALEIGDVVEMTAFNSQSSDNLVISHLEMGMKRESS